MAAQWTRLFSAGSGSTSVSVPAGACDCHVHVYDGRYPAIPGAKLRPADASVEDYRRLQRRTGTGRVVFVTPSTYGTENRPMLAALAHYGPAARGVAVVDERVSDDELARLAAAGVRGIRLNLSLGLVNGAEHIEALAEKAGALGWHLQLLAPPDRLVALASRLVRLPVPIVFDHFGRIAPSMAGRHDAHRLICRLLDAGRAWMKLSGGYIVSEAGPPEYPDVAGLVASYARIAPERLVWGSDWPHASATAGHQPLPDDAHQMNLLARWLDDASALHQVLVDNPARLYGFETSTPSAS